MGGDTMKSFLQSKTFWVAVAQLIVALSIVIRDYEPALDGAGYALIIKSFIDVYLRFKTDTPLTFKIK